MKLAKEADQLQQDIINEFGSRVTQEKYARIAKEGLWESEKVLIKKYFRSNSSILDVGCGTGRTTIPLWQMGYDVIGVDITPQMTDAAIKIANSKNLNIDYRIGDATHLDFEDNTFDNAIFANNGWTQIPGEENRQKALNEIFRVLKPEGCLIFTAHRRYFSGTYFLFWVLQWIKFYILKQLGFRFREIDFGDRFFYRIHKDKKLKQKQYIHIASIKEVENQIAKAGFSLIESKLMSEISETDGEHMKATLSKGSNAYKSPVFYICEKP